MSNIDKVKEFFNKEPLYSQRFAMEGFGDFDSILHKYGRIIEMRNELTFGGITCFVDMYLENAQSDTLNKIQRELREIGWFASGEMRVERDIIPIHGMSLHSLGFREGVPPLTTLSLTLRPIGAFEPRRTDMRLTHDDMLDAMSMLRNNPMFPTEPVSIFLHPDHAKELLETIAKIKEPVVKSDGTNSDELRTFFKK